MNMNMENMAKKMDLDRLENKFMDYAPLSILKDVREDINDVVKKEDFDICMRTLDNLTKNYDRLCPKDEFLTRLNVFNSDMNTKL